jgi:hypothetical protein
MDESRALRRTNDLLSLLLPPFSLRLLQQPMFYRLRPPLQRQSLPQSSLLGQYPLLL